jgi:hypothetical protein
MSNINIIEIRTKALENALENALCEAENAIICQNLSLSSDKLNNQELEDNVQNKGRCVQTKGMLFLCALNNQILSDHGIECFNDKKYIIKVLKQLDNDIYIHYVDLINGWDAWNDFFNNPTKYK